MSPTRISSFRADEVVPDELRHHANALTALGRRSALMASDERIRSFRSPRVAHLHGGRTETPPGPRQGRYRSLQTPGMPANQRLFVDWKREEPRLRLSRAPDQAHLKILYLGHDRGWPGLVETVRSMGVAFFLYANRAGERRIRSTANPIEPSRPMWALRQILATN
jgi:hypothetical protein